VKLDQKSCRYVPHVVGVRVTQPLEISNSDATLHNVHGMPDTNREFNFGQIMAGIKNTVSFTAPEVMVPFKCDVHSWMSAYIGVVSHPYFAVTDKAGTFELNTVPPGTYTIEAWHEKLGRQTQSVTLGEKDSKEISFTFKVQ
jgi:plastocyanin